MDYKCDVPGCRGKFPNPDRLGAHIQQNHPNYEQKGGLGHGTADATTRSGLGNFFRLAEATPTPTRFMDASADGAEGFNPFERSFAARQAAHRQAGGRGGGGGILQTPNFANQMSPALKSPNAPLSTGRMTRNSANAAAAAIAAAENEAIYMATKPPTIKLKGVMEGFGLKRLRNGIKGRKGDMDTGKNGANGRKDEMMQEEDIEEEDGEEEEEEEEEVGGGDEEEGDEIVADKKQRWVGTRSGKTSRGGQEASGVGRQKTSATGSGGGGKGRKASEVDGGEDDGYEPYTGSLEGFRFLKCKALEGKGFSGARQQTVINFEDVRIVLPFVLPKENVKKTIKLLKEENPGLTELEIDAIKRQKFLERNRAAASRCRKKKKTEVGNLEQGFEELSQHNSMLQMEISALRDEVVNLKEMLLRHKDCSLGLETNLAEQLTLFMAEKDKQLGLDT